jgi:hypothetical protein
MENRPFKSTALAYTEIEEFMKAMTSVEQPLTLQQIYDQILTLNPDSKVKNKQQVNDCLKKHRSKNVVHRLREGMQHMYWWDDKAVVKTEKQNVEVNVAQEIRELSAAIQKQKPEIVVKSNCVIITNDKIKITVEF